MSRKDTLAEKGFGAMKIYGDRISGNCLKVKYVADHLGLPYEWIDIDILKGESRTPDFLALNPAGQVPCVVLDDERVLAQSNAIMVHLAEGSSLIPRDAFDRAKMYEWLFWEQYTHEPAIAVARFQRHYLGRDETEFDGALMERGYMALGLMDRHLTGADWFAGPSLSLADIALVAYTRLSHEGGFTLAAYPQVRRWISAVEEALGLEEV